MMDVVSQSGVLLPVRVQDVPDASRPEADERGRQPKSLGGVACQVICLGTAEGSILQAQSVSGRFIWQ